MAPNSADLITFAQYVAPVMTPREASGHINYDIIPLYVEYLIATGVQGILVGGTAGQGILHSIEERLLVAKAFVFAVRRRIVVMVHTGGTNYRDTLELSDKVSKLDVDGIMLSPPIYYPYYNYTGLLSFLVDAGEACNGKPILYYHFPSLTNLDYNITQLITGLKERLPNFLGLKYTATDNREYKELLDLKVKIFLGFPSMTLLGAQTQGSDVSLITGPTNFVNGSMMKIVNLVIDGNTDKAQVVQEDLNNLMKCIVVEKELMASMFYIMDIVGLPMGSPTKPLCELTEKQKELVKANLGEPASSDRFIDMIHIYTG